MTSSFDLLLRCGGLRYIAIFAEIFCDIAVFRTPNVPLSVEPLAHQSEISTDFQRKVLFKPFREFYVGLEMPSD